MAGQKVTTTEEIIRGVKHWSNRMHGLLDVYFEDLHYTKDDVDFMRGKPAERRGHTVMVTASGEGTQSW
jgi:hypothetical protein